MHRTIAALILIAAAASAGATRNGPPPGQNQAQEQRQTQGQTQTASAAGGASAVHFNGSGSDAWAVGLPGFAAPSLAGQYSVCSSGRVVLFGVHTQWGPDFECLRLIAELDRLARTPVPQPARYPMAETVPVASSAAEKPEVAAACSPPAKAKSVAAAKKAGACKS